MGCAHPPTSAIDQTPGLLWLLIPVNVGLAGLGPKIQATIKRADLCSSGACHEAAVFSWVAGSSPAMTRSRIPTSPYLTP